ncbi:hypothetical protein RB10168 [Rhodopirellula baltica SH 1]|uniref:Uncharacterized protein n=2 Tax=Rhodopirellula baltica TaxID=265606 RepID=Q7UFE2_RHOBA|nr:hypothetical protein RB10168 [Rhodopirellula baltica SH 1]
MAVTPFVKPTIDIPSLANATVFCSNIKYGRPTTLNTPSWVMIQTTKDDSVEISCWRSHSIRRGPFISGCVCFGQSYC